MNGNVIMFVGLLVAGAVPGYAAPKVALVYTARQADKLRAGEEDPLRLYRAAIVENGGEVVDFYQGDPDSVVHEKLAQLDAVLLPGGGDVDPRFYNRKRHEKTGDVDAELDELEFEILRHAERKALPVLGICRGEQLLNVYYDGTLVQDIPTFWGEDNPIKHRFEGSNDPLQGHSIAITPGTRLHAIFGQTQMDVNSSHHQAVDILGAAIVVSARSPDGVIEAIERQGEPFVVGVEFHPEKMRAARPEINALFKTFIDSTRVKNVP